MLKKATQTTLINAFEIAFFYLLLIKLTKINPENTKERHILIVDFLKQINRYLRFK